MKYFVIAIALIGLGIYFAPQLSTAHTKAIEVKAKVEDVAVDANRTYTQAKSKASAIYDAATK